MPSRYLRIDHERPARSGLEAVGRGDVVEVEIEGAGTQRSTVR